MLYDGCATECERDFLGYFFALLSPCSVGAMQILLSAFQAATRIGAEPCRSADPFSMRLRVKKVARILSLSFSLSFSLSLCLSLSLSLSIPPPSFSRRKKSVGRLSVCVHRVQMLAILHKQIAELYEQQTKFYNAIQYWEQVDDDALMLWSETKSVCEPIWVRSPFRTRTAPSATMVVIGSFIASTDVENPPSTPANSNCTKILLEGR